MDKEDIPEPVVSLMKDLLDLVGNSNDNLVVTDSAIYRVDKQSWTSDSESDSDSDSSSSSSDDSSSSSSLSSDDESSTNEASECKTDVTIKNKKVVVEEGLHLLPPIENLKISVDSTEISLIGTVSSIIEELVVIQASKNVSPLNLESVLFSENGESLGKVFDVFGPVHEPLYSLRFNSQQDILDKAIKVGDNVYCAPDHPEFTQYVFMEQLRQYRATDASWENDQEAPNEICEFSDDEEEKKHKMKKNSRRKSNNTDHGPTKSHRNNQRKNPWHQPSYQPPMNYMAPSYSQSFQQNQYYNAPPQAQSPFASYNTNAAMNYNFNAILTQPPPPPSPASTVSSSNTYTNSSAYNAMIQAQFNQNYSFYQWYNNPAMQPNQQNSSYIAQNQSFAPPQTSSSNVNNQQTHQRTDNQT